MKIITEFPRETIEIPDLGLIMPDGCRLSARVWMPKDAETNPVPAIIEHLPYRKRDGTTARDCLTHPYFAGHGYASIRVDMRGNGDSQGLMEDEYSEQELADAVTIINWVAQQRWCTGAVGMMGISWGGFNSLQVAAKQPAPLKAIITLCSTDDRYADDIHYKGGLLLNENMGWGATMLSYSSRAPDPELVGPAWRDMWLDRLENEPFLPAIWLNHQTRDAYWKRGSICEHYSQIKAATLAIGGWGDGYKNAVLRLVRNISAPVKGIIGPWIHKYPHFAVPDPAIGFLQEALRWWDRWLKNIETGVENEPDMRLFLMDSEEPREFYDKRQGRWIAEPVWPAPQIATQSLHLGNSSTLSESPTALEPISFSSPQDCGMMSGEYCAIWQGPELPGDQSEDDDRSICFDGDKLSEKFALVGAPIIRLKLKVDRPQAMIAVRLCDIQPSGASARITYGVLNLTHRKSHETPSPCVPGEVMEFEFKLDDIAYQLLPGHRLRVAISNSYWPIVWPSPEKVTTELLGGELILPIRAQNNQADEVSFALPEAASPWKMEEIRPASNSREVEIDEETGAVSLVIRDDFGESRDLDHGLVTGEIARERWTIHRDDPLSAEGSTHWSQFSFREGWNIRTEAYTSMHSDNTTFHLSGRIEAYHNNELVFERDFQNKIPRNNI